MRYPLILLLFLAGLVLSSWYYECRILEHCPMGAVEQPPEQPPQAGAIARLKNLSLSEESTGKLPLTGYEQFAFAANSNQPNLSANNNAFIAKVVGYMKANPKHKLKLTGYYLRGEKNKDSHANMGVSRADKVRKILIAKGIGKDRFEALDGVELARGAKLDKPISFVAVPPSKEKKKYASTAQTFEDRTYYFDYSSDAFVPTDQFKLYTEEVKKYLSEDKKRKVEVIGHTDADGSDYANQALGLKRAKMIRNYLRDSGIAANRITHRSLGESDPAATNETDAGKAKNRRVNVKLK